MSHPSNQSANGVNVIALSIMDMAEADKGLSLNTLVAEIERWLQQKPIPEMVAPKSMTAEDYAWDLFRLEA